MTRAGGGFDASYNAQTAVDETAHIIVAAELTNSASDAGQLPVMLKAVGDNLGQRPKQVLADTGYRGEVVFEQLASRGTDVVVSLGREGRKLVRFDPQRSPLTAQMADKLQTDEARNAYRRHKWIAEPPNGWIKHVLGMRQFSLRGLHRVSAEWKLVCMALNLRRMATLSAS